MGILQREDNEKIAPFSALLRAVFTGADFSKPAAEGNSHETLETGCGARHNIFK